MGKLEDWDDDEDGEWEAPMKANPEFAEDPHLYKYAEFGFIGFDLWQVKGNTIFDNIIITDDAAEADNFVKKWKTLSELEKTKLKEAEAAKASETVAPGDDDDDDDDKDGA